MGVEYQEPIHTEAGPIVETLLDKMTGLETEVGHNGAVLAVAFYLTRDSNSVTLSTIRSTLNRSGLSEDQIIDILAKAKFRRVTFQKAGLSDRMIPFDDDNGEDWVRPIGKETASSWDFTKDEGDITLDEARIVTLVIEHMNERPRVNFELGERSEHADMTLDNPKLHGLAVVEKPNYKWASWNKDDPTTEQ